jgi:hypothetical protein
MEPRLAPVVGDRHGRLIPEREGEHGILGSAPAASDPRRRGVFRPAPSGATHLLKAISAVCYRREQTPRSKLAAPGTFYSFRTFAMMDDKSAEHLLIRINALLVDQNKLVQNQRKRLKKAGSRSAAEALEREIALNVARIDVLKIQQKALKRGIIPEELKNSEAA